MSVYLRPQGLSVIHGEQISWGLGNTIQCQAGGKLSLWCPARAPAALAGPGTCEGQTRHVSTRVTQAET